MKKFLDKNIKKIILMVSILLVVSILVLLCLLLFNKSKIKEYSNNIYSISYDNSWVISKESKSNLTLKHSDNGIINIKVIELDEDYKYDNIDTLIDEIIYGISKQNSDYVLLGQESTYLTKNNIYGYKLLYEYKDKQVMVMIIKDSNKLVAFSYEAGTDYFDILLDSALNVFNNFKFSKLDYKYNSKLDKVKTSKLNLKADNKVDSVNEYQISNNHYTVKYTIPSNFTRVDFDSTRGFYRDLSKKDYNSIMVTISNLNVYEEINNKYGILDDIKDLEEKEYIKDLKYEVSNGDSKDSYTYYITYKSNDKFREQAIMIIPLDKNHTLKIDISSHSEYISKDIIDSIKLKNKEKYNQDIDIKVDNNNNLINVMKILEDTKRDKYHEVTLYTPFKYKEIDKKNNKYSYRYFGIDYDEDSSEYKTVVSYQLSGYKKDIDSIKREYSAYEDVKFTDNGIVKYNNIEYNLYTVSYIYGKELRYDKRIITNLDSFGILEIKVTSNKNIDNNIFNELINYKLVTKDLK